MKKIYDNKNELFAELNYSKNYYLQYSKHSHDALTLTVFQKGNLEVLFHDLDELEVNSKQIIVYNPNQVHQTKSKRKNVENYFTLYIDCSCFEKLQKELFKSEKGFISLQNIISDEKVCKKLYEILEKIYFDKSFNVEKLEHLLKTIIEKYTLLDEKKSKSEPKLLKSVEKYIEDNIERQISLADISKVVSYDESYITRVFKKKYGLTPHAYIVNKRVQKAKTKLANSKDINLAQLSSEVGFYDQSHFSKVFKKVFATTPNKYRSQ